MKKFLCLILAILIPVCVLGIRNVDAGQQNDVLAVGQYGVNEMRVDSSGNLTVTGSITGTSMSATDEFNVTKTDDGATGAVLELQQDSASPAANDQPGIIEFIGDDDAGNETTYATIFGHIEDPTDGAETGGIGFTAQNGTGAAADCGFIYHDGSYGIFSAGDGAAAGVVQSEGDFDLILQTGNAATGTVTLTDGAAGDLVWAPSGVGQMITRVTDDGAVGAFFNTEHVSASPAISDLIGGMAMYGKDDAANDQQYGAVTCAITNPADGSEQGSISISAADGAGTVALAASFYNAGGNGTISIGDYASQGVLTSSGAFDLVLNTNGGTSSGSLTLTDGAAGDLTFAPSGVGSFDIDVTDDGATGAMIEFYQDSASPAANDIIGGMSFKGNDDAANETTYAQFGCAIGNPADGSEEGTAGFFFLEAGAFMAEPDIGMDRSSLGLRTDSASSNGYELTVTQDSASPAGDDVLFELSINGNDDGANATEYASIWGVIDDPTDGAEEGAVAIFVQNGSGSLPTEPQFVVSATEIATIATDAGADGALLVLEHASASPAANDRVGKIEYVGQDDAANETTYVEERGLIADPSDGTEAAIYQMYLQNGTGTMPTSPQIQINGSSAALSVNRVDAGAEGSTIQLYQDSASPAASDEVGFVKFVGEDDASNTQEYAQISGSISVATDGSEAGNIALKTANGSGTVETVLTCESDGVTIEKIISGSTEGITATSETVAASVATVITEITTNGDSDLDNVSLAAGVDGQIKIFTVVAVGNAADSVKITPASMIGGTQITFAANPLGLGCMMIYDSGVGGWVVASNNGGTIS